MTFKYSREFRIRQYECDANGHVNNANYLRYMQETAFDASAAIGYDQERYHQMKRTWLIRETEIEYLAPISYDDRIVITTWVSDFQKVTSRRQYEIHHALSGSKAAAAYSDWVFLDTNSNKPAPIPGELAGAFFPEGLPENYPSRTPFPKPPPPPDEVYTYPIHVRWTEVDRQGHVNNAVYFEYMNECVMQLVSDHGWPWERMTKEGIGMYARKVRIKYHRSAFAHDDLEISTWAYNMRRSTGNRHMSIRRLSDQALIASINTIGVWVDLENGRPIRIPDHLLKDFSDNIVQDSRI